MKATKIAPTDGWQKTETVKVTAPKPVWNGLPKRERVRKLPRPGKKVRVDGLEAAGAKLTPRERHVSNVNHYADRNATLRKMGFPTYKDYLASDLWKNIRTQVILRDKSRCRACKRRQEYPQVHHLNYLEETLRGRTISGLVTICDLCHADAEFDEFGHKTTLDSANAVIIKLASLTGKKKRRLQNERGRERNMKRLERNRLKAGIIRPLDNGCRAQESGQRPGAG